MNCAWGGARYATSSRIGLWGSPLFPLEVPRAEEIEVEEWRIVDKASVQASKRLEIIEGPLVVAREAMMMLMRRSCRSWSPSV